ncbi:MBL fold metallo-hydrolase [Mucilaginibacter sp. SG564]|uniref:MBL fold metallo-hydrolase n=1 Tax=Mucilaginibacter sp. SG564 TaxID=2587022 RepID=UPI001557147C|nr:MBL fold metallo-hydrolase [Mucilaginibacter sp. SG564]NOW96065.1 L-ascorbate metabolism protein UlaG (beta-lactamase superfamily) [Mucilaginibacter sp. SG564]
MNKHFNVIYLGGPTVILEIGGLRLMTDPTLDPKGETYMLGDKPGYWKTAGPAINNIGHIDAVLLSHDQHKDNLDNAGRELLEQVETTITTIDGAVRLGGNSKGLKPFERIALNDSISVTATPARHGPAGTVHITGEVIGFVVETSDVQVYFTGDTVYYDGIQQVAQQFSPGFVFIFAGAAKPRGPFNLTMGTNDALDTASAFPKAVIIPLHFEGWSHYTESDKELRQAFDIVGMGNRLRILEPGIATSF